MKVFVTGGTGFTGNALARRLLDEGHAVVLMDHKEGACSRDLRERGAEVVIASVTDALDGWIARRNKDITTFGKLMDPLADKLLVTSALVSLVSLDRLQAWVAMVIIAREFAVTGLRQLAMEHGEVIHASAWGKIKTTVQIAMVLVLILVDDSPLWVDLLVYATVVVTVASAVDYFFNFRQMVQGRRDDTSPSGAAVDRARR
jgi:CDP-diacylglycerol--glycerol-3-phosphate 3-phosphatidyltransferase